MEEEENYSLQTEPTWEHKALSGPIQLPVLGASLSYGKPPKRERITRGETPAKELNLEMSNFVFDRQPDTFRSGQAHQWLSANLTGENFSAHNHQRKTTNIVVFISDMG